MNQTDLLEQFVLEARDCLESIGKRLLEVERDPGNTDLLNDLFRSVHTLKGNCGLFEFKPLERVVHAGEDLLDRIRNRSLAHSARIADALLDAMDYSAELIDEIERTGRIADAADARSQHHAAALRALLEPAALPSALTGALPGALPAALPMPAPDLAPAVAVAIAPANTHAAPDWLARLDPALRQAHAGATALRYVPEPECFFKGEDPWRLASTTPGLLAVDVAGQQPWPVGDEQVRWDCYQCNLDIVLISSAPQADLEEHFRCVPEQVAYASVAAADAAADAVTTGEPDTATTGEPDTAAPAPGSRAGQTLRRRAQAIWADQLALLGRSGLGAGSIASARRALGHLLACVDDDDARRAAADLATLPGTVSAAGLLAWARQQPLGRAADAAAVEPMEPAAAAAWNGHDGGLAEIGLEEVPTTDAPTADAPRRVDDANGAPAQRVLKVTQEKVDRLMDLIGEMVVAKNSLPYLAQRAEQAFGQRELAREIKAQYAVINRIAEDMQHAIMQVRMLPVGVVFQRFGRLIRDISRKLGKDVNLVIEGEDTEADKNVIEPLADPLIHILRNSLDHGIERPEVRRAAGKPVVGTIRIRAHQESDRVLIEISDDGAGVDPARVRAKAVERGLIPADRAGSLSDADSVQLIFLPGFSTADAISDLSGRGVGMDVVRNAVERINGSVELHSVLGQGTTIRLALPLSMAVSNVMVIESAGRHFGVPMDLIVETVRVHGDDIHQFKQARTTVLRGRIVPLRALNELLALDAPARLNDDGEFTVLVLRLGTETVGLLVDQFHGASDIILKPLEGVLAGLTGFAGTALMGDGGVLMVLNPKELLP
ncbi:chemotaxis protein CheA [Leptothrix discophora]|uniref:histidine kinase n=1 Tax=Leptothrix discophora TaxID=89 RepID=A0ABT9G2N8_LEPDI|nr:chemotaxis protein CheA [Leptothrix discophora]MDP4300438.1 chemotaxis protein CheA [Leptothrix discophora]